MKNISVYLFGFFLILILSCGSCKTKLVTSNDFLPEIKNATIKSYQHDGERGYKASFDVDDSSFRPVGVIIHKVKQDFNTNNVNGQHYEINVIHESRRIQNFKPKVSNHENGVLFLVDSTYFLKKVKFKKD